MHRILSMLLPSTREHKTSAKSPGQPSGRSLSTSQDRGQVTPGSSSVSAPRESANSNRAMKLDPGTMTMPASSPVTPNFQMSGSGNQSQSASDDMPVDPIELQAELMENQALKVAEEGRFLSVSIPMSVME